MSAVLAQAYFLFLDGDMDDAAMSLGSVTGARPDVAWGTVPWFGDARFLGAVSAEALAEACLRTLDYGHDLDTDAMRERFTPWFHAIDVVSERSPVPESLAAVARLPRACGRYELAFALCDRGDAVDRSMWTAVARAGDLACDGRPGPGCGVLRRRPGDGPCQLVPLSGPCRHTRRAG